MKGLDMIDKNDPTYAAVERLFAEQRLATLATMSAEAPYCNLVAFTPSDDLQAIFFVTPRTSTKYVNITQNPNVSLLIDSRTQSGVDPQAGMAVTALGSVVQNPGQDIETLKGIHAARHEHFKDFIYSPDCALLQVRVQRYILVNRLRDVIVLEIAGQQS
jgi:nitroimidazol reductase NimA-like FMN-containing flavoprotein (pyridoxamine 5'-phosphate oxidase superfamily)